MKKILLLAIEGLLLGIFTVLMTEQIMRLVIPAETLNTYHIPSGLNFFGAVELVIIYIVATIIIGKVVEVLSTKTKEL